MYVCDMDDTLNYLSFLLWHFSSAKDSFNFLLKYLETFPLDDALTLAEAKDEAVHTVIEFIKAPDMFQVILPIDCYG